MKRNTFLASLVGIALAPMALVGKEDLGSKAITMLQPDRESAYSRLVREKRIEHMKEMERALMFGVEVEKTPTLFGDLIGIKGYINGNV